MFSPKNMWHSALQNGNAQCCTGYCSGGGMSVRIPGMPSTTTDFTLQHPRRPSMPAKRSNPLSLTPPNGSDCAMYVAQKSLMVVMPALSWEPTSSARRVLPKTLEPRPKSHSFASATASSSLRILTMERTGPNTSSFMIFIEWFTFVSTVGG